MTPTWPAMARHVAMCAAALVLAVPAGAQPWSLGVSAGQTVFDPLSSQVGANHLTATLRYDASRGTWVYGSAAAPLRSGDPFWTAVGSGGRLVLASSRRGGLSLGADVGVHGYLFRDPIVEQTGTGGTIEALPVARLAKGDTAFELRGGWRGHALAYDGLTDRRGVIQADARVTHGGRVRLGAGTRIVRAPEGTFPFADATLTYTGSTLQAWVEAGRWIDDALDDVVWSAGSGYALNGRVRIWTTVRQDGRDPLYWSTPRRSWSAGITTAFGRGSGAIPAARRDDDGRDVIRLPVAEAQGTAVWVAGSFNGWQAAPMTRNGDAWVLRLPLAPGVYRYAFRSADGTWFVPVSVESRRDDGMGGHVAVLVVDR